jgi:hypothetical protein
MYVFLFAVTEPLVLSVYGHVAGAGGSDTDAAHELTVTTQQSTLLFLVASIFLAKFPRSTGTEPSQYFMKSTYSYTAQRC